MNKILIFIPDIQNDLNNRVVEFISDGANTMSAMVVDELQRVRGLFPKAVHIRCMAHKLHNLASRVAEHFPVLDQLMIDAKNIFTKSKRRRKFFARGGYHRPPKVIRIRWGSWVEGSKFYTDQGNIDSLRNGFIALKNFESKVKV